jgi:hypothetical protein
MSIGDGKSVARKLDNPLHIFYNVNVKINEIKQGNDDDD